VFLLETDDKDDETKHKNAKRHVSITALKSEYSNMKFLKQFDVKCD